MTEALSLPSYDAYDSYDAVVLAGGAARRLGGVDKPGVRVGGRSLLGRVLTACAGANRVVVVGPERETGTGRAVAWAREDPPGVGPLAALAAGLRHTERPLVAVLAADLPFLTAGGLRLLLDVPPGADGVLACDADGRDQPLTAVYRAEPLRRELAALAAGHGGTLAGLPMRHLVSRLRLTRVPGGENAVDCDTWEDIAAARARIRDHGSVLDEWIAAARAELGIDPATDPELDMDIKALLDAARDAAHGVARPSAPLTTFLIGYAAGRHGLAPAEAASRISALAERWSREREQEQEQEREQEKAAE
jgi:molybdopterin-guanine dinucleotide biosynthesis protein A